MQSPDALKSEKDLDVSIDSPDPQQNFDIAIDLPGLQQTTTPDSQQPTTSAMAMKQDPGNYSFNENSTIFHDQLHSSCSSSPKTHPSTTMEQRNTSTPTSTRHYSYVTYMKKIQK